MLTETNFFGLCSEVFNIFGVKQFGLVMLILSVTNIPEYPTILPWGFGFNFAVGCNLQFYFA